MAIRTGPSRGITRINRAARPTPTHTYFIANLRLVLEVEVQAGNQTASTYSSPGLWELLGRLPRPHWPALIRGDRDWGTQANLARAEQEGIPYLFKLRLTPGVKKTVERLMRGAAWTAAGQGWEGAETRRPLTPDGPPVRSPVRQDVDHALEFLRFGRPAIQAQEPHNRAHRRAAPSAGKAANRSRPRKSPRMTRP
jgi:hypothetical protein